MYSLKNIPNRYTRPAPPIVSRWIVALVVILAMSIILMRFLGQYIDNDYFWRIAVGISITLWFIAATGRLAIWFLKNVKANGFDQRREEWILSETRRSRRALQILNVSFITGHQSEQQSDVVTAMANNTSIITAQPDWTGTEGIRMSRIGVNSADSPLTLIARLFKKLIDDLSFRLAPLAEKTPLCVAFDISSTVLFTDVVHLWEAIWSESKITCFVKYIDGSGPEMIDNWLNNHFKENAMLLIVALQVAPANTQNSAEVAVALLFGNRLTQNSIPPLAMLHRPDASPAEELESGMRMAAYNVPVNDGIVNHLWLSGLNERQYAEVVIHQNKTPVKAVQSEAVINLDNTLGHAGAASPWLAFAAAAEMAQLTRLPQMIICGGSTGDVLWSTLVTPTDFRQEMDS